MLTRIQLLLWITPLSPVVPYTATIALTSLITASVNHSATATSHSPQSLLRHDQPNVFASCCSMVPTLHISSKQDNSIEYNNVISKNESSNLHFKIQYHASSWLLELATQPSDQKLINRMMDYLLFRDCFWSSIHSMLPACSCCA